MTCVVAISGMMGSGKSTLAVRAAAALPNAVVIAEDDFQRLTERTLSDVAAWWRRGGDLRELDLTDVVAAIRAQLERPAGSRPQWVLFETQFGRLHPQLTPWIGRQCWIEVPSDIALVRKISQHAATMLPDRLPAHESLTWLHGFCRSYPETTRPMFDRQRLALRAVADIALDGLRGEDTVCQQLLSALCSSSAARDFNCLASAPGPDRTLTRCG